MGRRNYRCRVHRSIARATEEANEDLAVKATRSRSHPDKSCRPSPLFVPIDWFGLTEGWVRADAMTWRILTAGALRLFPRSTAAERAGAPLTQRTRAISCDRQEQGWLDGSSSNSALSVETRLSSPPNGFKTPVEDAGPCGHRCMRDANRRWRVLPAHAR